MEKFVLKKADVRQVSIPEKIVGGKGAWVKFKSGISQNEKLAGADALDSGKTKDQSEAGFQMVAKYLVEWNLYDGEDKLIAITDTILMELENEDLIDWIMEQVLGKDYKKKAAEAKAG